MGKQTRLIVKTLYIIGWDCMGVPEIDVLLQKGTPPGVFLQVDLKFGM
jgi:hypothetical protein